MHLTREAVLGATKLPFEDVMVPEVKKGAVIRIQGMDGKAASDWARSMVRVGAEGKVESVQLESFMARMVILTAVDEEGKKLFGEGDIEALNKLPASVLKRLSDAASRLSGMGDEALKNSVGTPSDASRTD